MVELDTPVNSTFDVPSVKVPELFQSPSTITLLLALQVNVLPDGMVRSPKIVISEAPSIVMFPQLVPRVKLPLYTGQLIADPGIDIS